LTIKVGAAVAPVDLICGATDMEMYIMHDGELDDEANPEDMLIQQTIQQVNTGNQKCSD
jgi:hypothetical protein